MNETPRAEYYEDTDTLALSWADAEATKAQEVARGILLSYDKDNNVVSIDVEQATLVFGALLASKEGVSPKVRDLVVELATTIAQEQSSLEAASSGKVEQRRTKRA